MKKNILITIAAINLAYANTLDDAFKCAKTSGYIRAGYQNHNISGDKSYKDNSIGGKLHFESAPKNGISAGVTFYTTNKISKNEATLNGGVPFFDSDAKSYSIMGEAYLKGVFGNTTIKLGRQELDTPFADTDDIGMIPNTFEAGILINKDIPDTTIILAQVQKWAGVDAPTPQKFTKMQNNDSVQTLGITYEGIEGLALSGWYYDLKSKNRGDLDDISYIEATYSSSINQISYEIATQYAKQSYKNQNNAKIIGASLSIGLENLGLSFNGAYNKVDDNIATNGFGGGPFFTSMEHLTIDNMGDDAKATTYGVDFNLQTIGLNNTSFSYQTFEVKSHSKKANEDDFSLNYTFNKNLNITAIYSDIDDKINNDKFKNTRVFVNYFF